IRASLADVINPKFGLLSADTGLFRFTRLNTLNASARTCTARSPPMRNDRTSPMSTLKRPGPIRLLFTRLPYAPAAGARNADALSHRLPCFPYTSSEILSGRWLPCPLSALSTPVVAEKCAPLLALTIVDTCQSLVSARTRPVDAPGTWYTADRFTTCL